MIINKEKQKNTMLISISGRIDSSTAPILEQELKLSYHKCKNLILDFEEVDYISSAGLRVLLSAQKRMNKQGRMYLTGVNDAIMEVFEVTGFADILTIQ